MDERFVSVGLVHIFGGSLLSSSPSPPSPGAQPLVPPVRPRGRGLDALRKRSEVLDLVNQSRVRRGGVTEGGGGLHKLRVYHCQVANRELAGWVEEGGRRGVFD